MASHAFSPAIGGVESVSAVLATEFTRAGHAVKLATQTCEQDDGGWPFAVLRRPTARELWRAVRWCDLVFHNNLALRLAWPLAAMRRPWVVAHQTWISRADRSLGWPDEVKRALLPRAAHISISRAIAQSLPVSSSIIGNPYDAAVFRERPGIPRDEAFIFVGRLVSDKGADLLLRALARLEGTPRLTVVGRGPEEAALRTMAADLGIAARVRFAGSLKGAALAEELHRHRVLVVPSRWEEPFGVVALEGIACGCVVVGSAGGGLPEAIGPCGITFSNGDEAALAQALARVEQDAPLRVRLLAGAPEHLARHRPEAVAKQYLEVFARALK